MRFPKMSKYWVQLALLAAPFALAHAAPLPVPPSGHEFDWIDLSNCRVPSVRPPRLRAESDEGYSFQRRFIALEERGPCVLMETYIERLDGSDSPGMRVTGSRAYRFDKGRWREEAAGFGYFPYALRRKLDQQVFFVEAVLEDDIGDSAAAGGWYPSVSRRLRAGSKGVLAGPWSIETLFGEQGAVLQGLAVLLTQRLRTGSFEPRSDDQLTVERRRIELLMKSAWQSLPPAERVVVDPDGLPR